MTLSVVHVVPGLGRKDGGPAYSVPSLRRAQAAAGATTRLFTVASPENPTLEGVEADLCRQDGARVPIISSMRYSAELGSHLASTIPRTSVVHAHGLWLMPNVQAGQIARRNGKPLVISPRGMLAKEALAFSPLKKKLFWQLFQKRAYDSASVWHATSEAEAEDIRQFGVSAPICVIPNGVEATPAPQKARDGDAAPGAKTILYLGRVHPKKGLPSLIAAWAQLAHRFPHWRLRIVGPDEGGHAGQLTQLILELDAVNVTVEPAAFGDEKSALMAEADLFVLPTLNENFGIAVAEALSAGVPAIVTKGAPWAGLETEHCGWWIDHGPAPLAEALADALARPAEDLQSMGARGRAWIARDFSWPRIAADMLGVYRWITDGGDAPATVRLH